ncbi:MAG: restriction endonuclease subunit S, partial [bacterium]
EEYDTLTSDEKWPELADVILANPPFMSPKGGIRPHNRFAVQSKRSEVLFVDYIAEHLTPNGRAAVVVPEGIIFQSQTAYRQLREMLVKNYLVAVISLPAGVFNPYSGVKTSILVMDKRLTKQRNEVLFVKIENDGFNLGAQRRPIEKNDLPEAVRIVKAFLQLGEVAEHRNVLAVSREQIGENGEWNLSGDRHLETGQKVSDYEFVQIGDIATILNGYAFRSANYVDSGIRVIRITNVQKGSIEDSDPKFYPIESDEPVEKYRLFEGDLLVSLTGNVGRVGLLPNSLLPAALNQRVACIRPDEQKVLKNYLYYLLNQDQFERECIDSSSGVAQKNLSTKWLSEYEIPLPPQEVQKEIVAEIEGYQKIIDGARQVVENYQPRIPIHPDWPMEKIGGLVKINNGQVLTEFSGEENIACIKVGDMNLPENSVEIITSSHWLSATERPLLPVGSIVFPKRGAAIATNKKRFTRIPCLIDNNCMGLTVQDESKLAPKYLFYFLVGFDLSTISNSAGIALINNGDISGVDIPLPDIDIQKAIVTEIEAEQSLMDANKELIQRFEDKIKQTINRVWGEAE